MDESMSGDLNIDYHISKSIYTTFLSIHNILIHVSQLF